MSVSGLVRNICSRIPSANAKKSRFLSVGPGRGQAMRLLRRSKDGLLVREDFEEGKWQCSKSKTRW